MKAIFYRLSLIFLALFLYISIYPINTQQEEHSRSYMFTRPAYDHRHIFLSQWSTIIHSKKNPHGFQIISYVQNSISQEKSERYFLPHGKNELLVSGDDNLNKRCIRDIRAEWVGLPSNFSGILHIQPKQKQFGFSLTGYKHLSTLFDTTFFKHWYVALHVPFVIVENNIGLQQKNISNPNVTGNGPRDIIEAFTNNEWKFGALFTATKTKISPGEITFIVGSNIYEKQFHFYYETIIGLATGTKSDPAFLFSPYVGNDSHFELGTALGTTFALNRCKEKYTCSFFIDLSTKFLFQNKQYRTFDLKGKQWSRFLPMNKKDSGNNTQNIPGVNLLTFQVRSKPFNVTDFSTGFRVHIANVQFEIGYNLWKHGEERIRFDNEITQNFGIAGTDSLSTASTSTIAQQVAPNEMSVIKNDPTFVTITKCDIDINSAKSAKAQNHKLFFNCGLTHQGHTCDGIFGCGAFVDIPQKNNPFKTWGIWVKIGTTI